MGETDMTDLNLNNQTSVEETFIKRLLYDLLAFNTLEGASLDNPAGIKDYWKLENLLFGKVKPSLEVMQPLNTSLVSIPNQDKTYFTFPEISNKFISFQNSFRIPSQSGRLSEDIYLNSPEIYRAFVDSESSYNEAMTLILSKYNGIILQNSKAEQVKNIKDYAGLFFNFILGSNMSEKITKTSFILSSKVSAINSGLCIEIADLDPSNNGDKQSFIQGNNFEFYRQTAVNNGFVIDKNIPWRINFDLSSPVTPDRDYFLDRNFSETRQGDLDALISLVVVGYNSLVRQKNYYMEGRCKYARFPIDKEVVLRDVLSTSYWIKRYCQIRNWESGNIYTTSEIEKMTQIAIDLDDTLLSYVSSKFRIPYLFEGSTVYRDLKKYYLEKNNISLDNFSEHVKIIVKNSINKIY